ncbi:HNH endonuclease, partial [Staphylococcus saprophyticus]
NKSGDILENLVKLCPACHRALTPNRSESKYQKNLIKNILINSKSARDYVANFVSDPNDLNTKIEYVFSHLK